MRALAWRAYQQPLNAGSTAQVPEDHWDRWLPATWPLTRRIGSAGPHWLPAFRDEEPVGAVAAPVDDTGDVLVHIVEQEEVMA
jgi:hypothetical protein